MTASRRTDNKEVAVKFIVKDKVPEHGWSQDPNFGRIPTEVLLLTIVDHPCIAKCLDLYEDNIYYYLASCFLPPAYHLLTHLQVQELHGTPWVSQVHSRFSSTGDLNAPELTASSSGSTAGSDSDFISLEPEDPMFHQGTTQKCIEVDQDMFLKPLRPQYTRRPSHDLFECIEQSPHKRLSETQARHIFAQVVDAVAYLHALGITHCDIKDENILIDADLKVRHDFGLNRWC